MRQNALSMILMMAATVTLLHADALKLNNGPVIQGTLISANSREIVFLDADGIQKTYAIHIVSGIDFSTLPPASAPAAQAAYAKPGAAAPGVSIVPAGTRIAVRMLDSIDGKTARAGRTYQASLDDPVSVGSQVAFPKNANCIVEVVSVQAGDEMALRLREINIGGKAYSTSTGDAWVEATGTNKKASAVKRGVGLGALGAGIGAVAGGGQGAAIGAAIGGGVGAASASGARGKEINVPSETRLLFSLSAPVPLD